MYIYIYIYIYMYLSFTLDRALSCHTCPRQPACWHWLLRTAADLLCRCSSKHACKLWAFKGPLSRAPLIISLYILIWPYLATCLYTCQGSPSFLCEIERPVHLPVGSPAHATRRENNKGTHVGILIDSLEINDIPTF